MRPGNPVRVMLAQRLSDADEILARLGGQCTAEYKYDGMRLQAHRTADGQIELFTRRQERVSTQFPDVVELLQTGLGPREAILEGEVVAYDAGGRRAAPVPGGHVPPPQAWHRRGRSRRAGRAVLLRAAVRRRRGPHPAALSGASGAARRGGHLVGPAPADHGARGGDRAALWMRRSSRRWRTAREGLVCKSIGPDAVYQAGARGWLWIKLKRDYRTELADTVDLVVVGAYAGRGRRRGTYGAVLLAAYNPDEELYRTVGNAAQGSPTPNWPRCRSRLAPLRRAERPARVDSRVRADVWFEPGVVMEVLSAELTLSPNHTAGWGQLKDDAGLSMRFPRFTGRWRDDKEPQDATTTDSWSSFFERPTGCRPAPKHGCLFRTSRSCLSLGWSPDRICSANWCRSGSQRARAYC